MLSEEDLKRIEATVREAEVGTAAEIKVVIARRATDLVELLLWPALVALALPPFLLLLLPRSSAAMVYLAQLGVLALAGVLLALPSVRRVLVSKAARRRLTRRLAEEQFFACGLHQTAGATGVLLLVAVEEHCAELIADAGAEGILADDTWRPAMEALLSSARAGRLTEGVVAAVERIALVLHTKLPARPADTNEVADRPVLL
jgi:putative membrane protein